MSLRDGRLTDAHHTQVLIDKAVKHAFREGLGYGVAAGSVLAMLIRELLERWLP
jgi:hypothetical protein